MASLNVGNLGEYLREQRRTAQLSLRQLADAAGVSNPYLSQIERGLRKPSAEVLQQVAKALRISAETLYVRAGILDAERDRDEVETRAVILADPTLNERQKQVLLQIYESFRKENGFGISPEAGETDEAAEAVQRAAEAVSAGQDAVHSEQGDTTDADRTGGTNGSTGTTDADRKPASRRTRTASSTGTTRTTGTNRATRTTRNTRTSDGSAADPENPIDPQQSAG
ncbi:helix-turn-helix domain-containing protein [Streptomyces muensis]|uniref:Helix-turn-helix domain-containing protein n=1 Tax=Streptomyces muensis TaxID=1077944 RepID=A0A9X1Q8A7_STRM4|nr:helix-turn-helix transcriptional regulator [Streptomyces muensis]MCF1599734.1 helix-turn-helix domain-containing protein [Streptomyces muensis]